MSLQAHDMLWTGPPRAALTVLLAHGAGAPMDTPFMNFFAEGLAARGYRVGRFEFPYMAARRAAGKRKPPDRAQVLMETWREAVAAISSDAIVIGGKSMGGRIASMIADDVRARGLICLGYPFFGAGRRDKPRIRHLETLKTPTLICQGERDPMGDSTTVNALPLSGSISLQWAPDGNHDLKPRKASGRTHEQNLATALETAGRFIAGLPQRRS